jgi:1-acyl-sn-glycerol-3-phosphate acyltransferase
MDATPLIRWLARATCRLFYRVDKVGSPPASGPVLLLPNHPNALLDPAIVWATTGRDVRFLAKSTLFDGLLRPLVAGAGAIPVYRRHDEGVDVSRNAETFAAVEAALAAGDAICVFPEGISHSSGRLEPLRTGAARMALAAAHAGVRVALVPVGLNFERKTAFRSRVTVMYGPPFECADLVERGTAPAPAQVRALTDRIAIHMRNLLVEADPQGDSAIVDRVDRLYAAARGRPADAGERVARRRVIAGGIDRLRARDPQRYDEILLRLRRYDQRLRRFGIRDTHLDWNVSAADALRFAGREILAGFVAVPLAVAAMVLFYVPYRLTGFAARTFTSYADVAATAKVVSGALIYAAWAALAVGGAGWLGGVTAAIVTALALPAVAVAGLFAIERESAALATVRTWLALRRARRDTRARLRRHRSELADLLDEVNEWLQIDAAAPHT